MKRLTDPSFRYVPASKTNVAATFRRVRREMEAAAAAQEKKVVTIAKRVSK